LPAVAFVQAKAEKKGSFAIQVGTYQAKADAQHEQDKLAKSGISSRIVKQGKYTIVVVGSFGDKEMARPVLSRLRQAYRDCYIRRL
jgi:cell division protein FtsN